MFFVVLCYTGKFRLELHLLAVYNANLTLLRSRQTLALKVIDLHLTSLVGLH